MNIEIRIVAEGPQHLRQILRDILNEEAAAAPKADFSGAPDEPAADEAATEAKPATYRGDNAKNIAAALKAKLLAGEDLTEDEADDLTRLPKKFQVEIEEAVKARDDAEAADNERTMDPTASADDADELLGDTADGLVLHDVDGDKLGAYATAEEWSREFVLHLGNIDSAEAVTGFARANKDVVKTLSPEQRSLLDRTARERIEVLSTTKSAAPEVSQEDVKAAIIELNGKKGRPACEAVLQKFNATRMSEIPPEKYADFVAEVRKALAGS